MERVQLAINVTDLDEAIGFYSKLFNAQPAKVRPGYANFAIEVPPLKLVLMEGGKGGTLNHLGVEVDSVEQVRAATTRLSGEGLPTKAEQGTCCYAEQDKVWVNDPDGAPWEVYTVLGDAPAMVNTGCEAGACDPANAEAACC